MRQCVGHLSGWVAFVPSLDGWSSVWPPKGKRPCSAGPVRLGQRAIGGPVVPITPARHVLVINTDPSVLLAVHDLVAEAGYRVSLLSYYNHDLGDIKRLAPDLIVLDYKWSSDDNGWSLLQLMRLDPET